VSFPRNGSPAPLASTQAVWQATSDRPSSTTAKCKTCGSTATRILSLLPGGGRQQMTSDAVVPRSGSGKYRLGVASNSLAPDREKRQAGLTVRLWPIVRLRICPEILPMASPLIHHAAMSTPDDVEPAYRSSHFRQPLPVCLGPAENSYHAACLAESLVSLPACRRRHPGNTGTPPHTAVPRSMNDRVNKVAEMDTHEWPAVTDSRYPTRSIIAERPSSPRANRRGGCSVCSVGVSKNSSAAGATPGTIVSD
jgi:hypothetical protein